MDYDAMKYHIVLDKLSDEGGYEERDCEESSEFCAKLINDNTEQTPEIYRACAPPKMCSEEGHFTLVYHTGLHFHCCRGDNCNDASSTSIGISLLSVFYSLYLLL
ncbi:unnamed protein product [Bursaphelenchus okinawaensis]|uniref:Snake toxin/toxin-like domain-containing protein n=1 Tax=Bursaphelenchus okinawaensis TaxID=465554 RepID=A0A811L8Q8_9BILA|nr:unnamed protein product [Bursaphelenchus okinawaensis]CAG9118121.1 unnamed protein product [Bursaphelenchus okinawaensis]